MEGRLILRESAFEELLRSAYETMDKECIGSIFGSKDHLYGEAIWNVESAHPVQLAKRFSTSVRPLWGSIRADWSLSSPQIGGYHSHPDGKTGEGATRLNRDSDINLIKGTPLIEVIIAFNPAKSNRPINNNNPFLLSGYLQGLFEKEIYRFDLAAYFYSNRVRRATIETSKRLTKQIRSVI